MYFMNFLRTPISENGCFYIYAKYEQLRQKTQKLNGYDTKLKFLLKI